MQIIPAFNPLDTTKYPNGNGIIAVGAADEGSKLLLYNKCPADLNLDFLNGNQSIAHAKQARVWTLDGDTKQIGWEITSKQAIANPAVSIVQGELYGATETIDGNYPIELDTQTDFGNRLQSGGAALLMPLSIETNTGTTIAQAGSEGVTNYIAGISFTSQVATAGTVQYTIRVQNIIAGQDMYYYTQATTTQGAALHALFTPALPTYQAGLSISIIITVSGGTAGNYSLIAPVYQI